ncbi:phosphotransferase enzyme family protein [Trueperella pyogenes]|uniref:phosphotransferase enzyme family protein n=1 Tax=Trueperella pyogenes TaxID=1661 RepID=UPI0013DFDA87|nr:aminoglycoside phosphotransferase family protein [Trueperella pyogenes]
MAHVEFNDELLADILTHFGVGDAQIEPWGDGHINQTYRVTADRGVFILQRLNTDIFRDPVGLMRNVAAVTSFLRDKGRETLTIVPTLEGELLHDAGEHGQYRMYLFIADTVSYSVVDSAEVTRAAGAAFGQFQQDLADFDATQLVETIPNFHHTPTRLRNLIEAIDADAVGRVASARAEIEEYLARESDCGIVAELLAAGELPYRVTHNDTKINNILLDATTGQARAIIDLDTVMPGSMLYDFGDAMRTGAATTAEDDPEPARMGVNIDLFAAYCQGFVSTMADAITEKEAELLAFSVKLMSLECGMRFLTDYLQGDVYFATAYPEHNLVRTRTQLALVKDIEAKMADMNEIVRRALAAAGEGGVVNGKEE